MTGVTDDAALRAAFAEIQTAYAEGLSKEFDFGPAKSLRSKKSEPRVDKMKLAITSVLAALALTPNIASAQSNLGAVPADKAISSAKDEVGSDPDTVSYLWINSDIRAMHKGWCVILHGVERASGKSKTIPVFIEQDGRPWRMDAVGTKKYDGGADGLYMPPGWGSDCRVGARKRR